MAENVTKARPANNGIDSDAAKGFIDQVEAKQAEIDQIMDAAKSSCSPLRDAIKEIKEEAIDKLNVSRNVLNAKIGERRDIRRALGRRSQLDEEHQDQLDQLTQALGDYCETPLGQAAQVAQDELQDAA